MEIQSEGYTAHYTLEEMQAFMKLVGQSTVYGLMQNFGLTEHEATLIQNMYAVMAEIVTPSKER